MRIREGYQSEQIRNESFALVNLSESQKKVYEIIKKWQPLSSESIAMHLGVYPHHVTPRVLELRQLGFVEFCGESTSDRTGRRVSLWRISANWKQLKLNL